MALFKRNKIWHADFSVNGQRFRQSLDTTDWREAQRSEKELIGQASAGKLAPSSQQFARRSFGEAAERYLADREAHLAPKSVATEKQRLKVLRAHFGTTALNKITADAIMAYIPKRRGGGAANRTINMELGILRRILKKAKRWYLVADDVRPLPERRDVGRALAHGEKVRLLQTAASRPEWQTAYLAAVLALNTTMRSCEIRGLRWHDVDFIDWAINVRRSKTEAGERTIPLNDEAWAAVLQLRDRAKALFGDNLVAHWYVFPHAEGFTTPDPTKPMSGWRTAWRSLTREAGLRGLRFHDLRHHAITELAESESASEQTIMAIAGHVSTRMLRHYSLVRRDAMRRALESLSRKPAVKDSSEVGTKGYVTKHGTNGMEREAVSPQVVDLNGGADGVRTRDLLRDRQAF